MTNPSIEKLEREIERLVREHVAACHRAASAALQRAFAGPPPRAKPAPSRPTSRRAGVRRASTEIAALGERLYEAVCAQPGETMTVLGPVVGASARELHRPMSALKRAGRIRSVGERHQARYFPMVPRSR